MKSTSTRVLLTFLAVSVLGFALLIPQPADSYECRVIRVYGEGSQPGKIHIEPKVLTIQKGTCVVWLNWSKEQVVSVKFEEDQKCHDVTKAPVLFALDAANCYVTSWIPRGGTSSLKFTEAGEFQYFVTNRDGSEIKGLIFVQEE